MSSTFQTVAALAIVALAVAGLIWRALSRHGRQGGCGSCPTDEFKAKLKR